LFRVLKNVAYFGNLSYNNRVLPLGQVNLIMSQDFLIKLSCKTCKRINYWSRKNKKKVERKIDLNKYCKWCKKHTQHIETKK